MTGMEPIVKVRGLHKHFGSIHIIKGVDLDVRPGEAVAIMGPSGGGKSTFLRCLNFLEEPSAGTIQINDVEINAEESTGQRSKRIREIRQSAAMVFQEFNLFQHMTVLGNIIEGAVTVKRVPKEQAISKADELITRIGLLEKRDDFPSHLAAGEQQQVAIARSLCLEPQIMLFDDPTSALDPILVSELVDVMRRLVNEGIAIIIVTNDPHLVRNIADRVILLENGVWVEMAPPEWFPNYRSLKRQSKNFQQYHNKNHRYSFLKGKTPLEVIKGSGFKPVTIGGNTKLPRLDEIPDGNIILIRFIRSDRVLNVFGEKFKVSRDLVYSYIKAVIITKIRQLQIYLGDDLVDTLDYPLSASW